MNERDSSQEPKLRQVWQRAQGMADQLRTTGGASRSLFAKGALGVVGLLILDILVIAGVVALIRWIF